MIGRALSCEASVEDPGAPALPQRVVSLDAGQQSETRTRRSSQTKRRLRKVKTAVVRFFRRDKEVVDVEQPNEPNRTESRSCSAPRTSAMPSSVIRSRKAAAPALPLSNDRSRVPQSRRISFTPAAVSRDNSQEATSAFFRPSEAPIAEQLRKVFHENSSADEKASIALGTVRLRDDQIWRMRVISQEQQRELETNRKLVTTYISRHREASEDSNEWQSQCEKALKLADHWKLEADKQAKRADDFQQDAESAFAQGQLPTRELLLARERCDVLEEEKASALYESALMRHEIGVLTRQKQDCLSVLQLSQNEGKVLQSEKKMLLGQMQETLGAFQVIQGEGKILRSEKHRLEESLKSTRRDYELLLNQKTAQYNADPTLQDPFSVKPDEVRSLMQTLEQSKRTHDAERHLHSQKFDRAQQLENEAAHTRSKNSLLNKKLEQLEILNESKSNADLTLLQSETSSWLASLQIAAQNSLAQSRS